MTEGDSAYPVPGVHVARAIRRHLPAGVVAVTTVVGEAFRAATVSACIITSLQPLMVLVSLEEESQMPDWISASQIFGVCVLTRAQQFFADQFAGYAPLASARFDGIQHFTARTGAPLLSESIAWVDCRLTHTLTTGDHLCLVGEALAAGQGQGAVESALVYYLNRYRRIEWEQPTSP